MDRARAKDVAQKALAKAQQALSCGVRGELAPMLVVACRATDWNGPTGFARTLPQGGEICLNRMTS
jgi:hypothetical protein